MIDVDHLLWCDSATRALDPDLKITGWQHELVRPPLVSCDFDPPTIADCNNLQRLERRLKRKPAIGTHDLSEHLAVNNALLTTLLQTLEIGQIL